MGTNRLTIILLVSVLFAIGLLVYLSALLIIPKNPNPSYFPSIGYGRLSEVKWTISRYQPIFLRYYQKNEHIYINTIHRNTSGFIKLLTVDLGSDQDQHNQAILVDMPENSNLKDVVSKLSPGQRISIGYFNSATHRPGQPSEHASQITDKNAQRLCQKVPYFCIAANASISNNDQYWSFEHTGNLTVKDSLVAIYFSTQTINER